MFPPYQYDLFDYNQRLIPFPQKRGRKDYEMIIFEDGRIPYSFQAENIDFAINQANTYDGLIRCMIADDTGLGKTISSIGILTELEAYPVLIICMTTLKIQYLIELYGLTGMFGQIIWNNKTQPEDRWKCHIISYDLLKKYKYIEMLNPRLIIIDECQKIKNWESERTKALVDFCASRKCHIIMTSATPIENNAYEFFPTFHILRPDRFQYQNSFANMCEYVRIGAGFKLGGISVSYMKIFKEMTKDIIIRHRRNEVYKDLPTERINHRFIKIEEEKPLEAIKREMENYLDIYDRVSNFDSETEEETRNELNMKLQASFMIIRHIVGDAKVPYILSDVENFLESYEEDRRLTLFIHHKSVAEALINGIGKFQDKYKINKPFTIRGGMNENERMELIGACTVNKGWPTNNPRDRLMIASTLGIPGVNLQKCYDAKLCERQFNPSKEAQAAPGRFARPGAELLTDSIFIDIYTALETIDEYLNQIVEVKRGGFHRTMGDAEGEIEFDEQSLVKQLMDKLASEGRKWIKKGF